MIRRGGIRKGVRAGQKEAPVVSLVSLGCAKNTVDAERVLAALIGDGFLLAEDPRDADLCLVNTCGFIQAAREESAAVLGELAALRQRAGRPRLVALGCLVERVARAPDFAAFLDAADARVGFGDYIRLPRICRQLCATGIPGALAAGRIDPAFHRLPRLLTGSPHAVSLKIAEGCANRCRFCSIPLMRGPQVSRTVDEIVAEAHDLLAAGAREISLIAQDTTAYGQDLYGERRLAHLLRALAAIETDAWFRLMYAFPGHLDETVLDVLSSDARFCPYLDLPLQHIRDRILSAMGRGMGRDATVRLLDRIAERWPEVELRSAFIVGFPGETDADVQALVDFVSEGRFLYAGVFGFSAEEGTPAARLPNRIPEAVIRDRVAAVADACLRATGRRLKRFLALTIPVLVDGPIEAGDAETILAGRTRFQAPEVDGWCRILSNQAVEPGDRVPCVVREVDGVDLVVEAVQGVT